MLSYLGALALAWSIQQFELVPEEKPQDRHVAAVLSELDGALTADDKPRAAQLLLQLKRLGGRAATERLLRSTDANKRALAVFGLRHLKVLNAWQYVMIMLADVKPNVRRQVYFYAAVARYVDVSDVKMGLNDFAPEVRLACIHALVTIGSNKPKSAKAAGEAMRARLATESDPAVKRGLELGLMSLGQPR